MLTKDAIKIRQRQCRVHVYDFKNKIAGSVVECPCKIYRANMSTLQNPTNLNADWALGFYEESSQANIDKIKSQEGTSWVVSSSVNNNIVQLMLELDLTPLCILLYGGNNAKLKTGLNSIQADIWTMGTGSNSGVTTNGVTVKAQGCDESGVFTGWYNAVVNNASSIALCSILRTSDASSKINSSNKLNILIHATFPSNGTIPSSVSLDCVKISITIK